QDIQRATMTVSVTDVTGNKNEIVRSFAVSEDGEDGGPLDRCPNDPDKLEPGTCGCGIAETDTDSDGTPDCLDRCPQNPLLVEPQIDESALRKAEKALLKAKKKLKKLKKSHAPKNRLKKARKKIKRLKGAMPPLSVGRC
ncbi:MAG: hypothetical protein J5J00_02385, partial [Deltaproteobacteria bacterium]|nr:hypothetical protein [Deltaproteobacteria bacterium]